MEDILVKINGEEIQLTEFPAEFIKNSICGMLRSLKGVKEINHVEIKFKLWMILTL